MGMKLYFKGKEEDMHRPKSRKSTVPQGEENKANMNRHREGWGVLIKRANKTKMKERKGKIKVLPAGERFTSRWSLPH